MLTGIFMVLTAVTASAEGFDGHTLDAIEGVWQIPDGATLSIAKDAQTAHGGYAVTAVDSPDLRVTPGTVIGHANVSDREGVNTYALQLFTDIDTHGNPCSRRRFECKVDPATGTMSMQPQARVKFDLWMLYRLYLTMSMRHQSAPKALQARRIEPAAAPSAQYPVTL